MFRREVADPSPEFRLLLACLNQVLGTTETAADLSHEPTQSTDWERFLRHAAQHALSPLLFHGCRSLDLPFPKSVFHRLAQGTTIHAQRSVLLTSEMLRIVRTFMSDGLLAVSYKGPSLGVALYGDVALRQFGDLDILVRRADITAAASRLLDQGYHAAADQRLLRSEKFIRQAHSFPFALQVSGYEVRVDLHWRVVSPRYLALDLDLDQLTRPLQQIEIGGVNIPVLAPNDLFLALSIHGAKHYWERLAWAADLALLCKSDEVDWDECLEAAARLRITRIVLLGAWIAASLLNAPIPWKVRVAAMGDRHIRGLAATATEMMSRDDDLPMGIYTFPAYHVALFDRVGSRLRYLYAAARSRCSLP